MAKLSDLFGRKGGETGASRGVAIGQRAETATAITSAVENFSDVGSRMGEENEVLRNLLTDTGRKIGELDELKEAFDKIVAPFNSDAARARAGKVADAGPLRHAERVARGLRDAAHRILPDREEGDRARSRGREAARGPRTGARDRTARSKARASNSPTKSPPADAQIAELERQLAQETSQRRTLSENRRTLQEQLDAAEKRNMRARGRACRRAREAGAAGRREALAADRGRSGAQRDRPPHPPAHREREHADRDPRPARQGRGQLRRSLCRTRPACRRARRDQRAAPGRAQQPEHAARRAAVARRHRRAPAVRGAAEPDRPHRGSARLRPQVGGSDHRPQQRRKAARPDRGHRTKRASARSRISSRRARRSPSATMP